MSNFKLVLSFAIVALSVACLTVLGGIFESGELSVSARSPLTMASPQPTQVQRLAQQPLQELRVSEAWRLVYQQLPDFPKENNYVSKETGKVDPNNTLVGRLIRYHLFVKGRPGNYRLDWKLTLADYLGVTPEFLEESVYPGGDVLRLNPMERDRTVIQGLNRAQRDTLIQVLVDIFNGNAPSVPAAGGSQERSPSEVPPAPQPGDAKLLMP
ncbi:hypothetical protein PN499_13960 [Kamptonema animale CS-326]|uniref:hypothetical protein n=1 Tax=Kamptonema animale TaxID=92934 RepID=UPI00232C8E06|nr:hypothetical protein [Kamptonema animale]MDB9512292.1 hypothetical protein [Kamptonema animale CS-326]